jgi:hypothetical protein
MLAVRSNSRRMTSTNADEKFLDFGFQYYIAARFGTRARLSPVAGNLFHHAIEMFLKAYLSRSMSSDAMKNKLGHKLKRQWDAFKSSFPTVHLSGFDKLIEALDSFETIRYPDELITKGAEIVLALDRNVAGSTGQIGGTPIPRYEVVLADVDELVRKIFALSSRNPAFFTNPLNDYAREALKFENSDISFFLPK